MQWWHFLKKTFHGVVGLRNDALCQTVFDLRSGAQPRHEQWGCTKNWSGGQHMQGYWRWPVLRCDLQQTNWIDSPRVQRHESPMPEHSFAVDYSKMSAIYHHNTKINCCRPQCQLVHSWRFQLRASGFVWILAAFHPKELDLTPWRHSFAKLGMVGVPALGPLERRQVHEGSRAHTAQPIQCQQDPGGSRLSYQNRPGLLW